MARAAALGCGDALSIFPIGAHGTASLVTLSHLHHIGNCDQSNHSILLDIHCMLHGYSWQAVQEINVMSFDLINYFNNLECQIAASYYCEGSQQIIKFTCTSYYIFGYTV